MGANVKTFDRSCVVYEKILTKSVIRFLYSV